MTKRTDIATRLKDVKLFERCTKGDLRIIAGHADIFTAPAGSTIIRQGDHGDTFFMLLNGRATVERDGSTVGELGPGDWFGELALLDPAPRAATITARTETELAVVGTRMFRVLLRELPALAAVLLASLARQARNNGSTDHA